MSKFKSGDKIIGNRYASDHYRITKEGWVGRIINTGTFGTSDLILVTDYDNLNPTKEESFIVNKDFFDHFTKNNIESIW